MIPAQTCWPPERRWLCRLARRTVPASTLADLACTNDRIDWQDLLSTADTHGVQELLLAPLTAAGGSVPAAVTAALQSRAVAVTAQNLSRARQLGHVMQRLQEHGIRALAFKGPTLAVRMYGHLARRISVDLDVLVDRRQVTRVRPLLLADGYTLPPRRRHRAGSLFYGLYPSAARDETLCPPHPDLAHIEVHVDFARWTHGIQLDLDGLFERAVTVNLAGFPIPTLCPADLLLMSSIHGMMHGWSSLRLVTDIDAIAADVDDWVAVASRAESAHMSRVLWVALLLSHGVLGTALPQHILALAGRDRKAIEVSDAVAERLFDLSPVVRPAWDTKLWFLSFRESRRDRLRFHARDLMYEWFLKWPWDDWLGRRPRSGIIN